MQKVHCRQLGTFFNLFCKLFKRFNYFSSPAPQLSAIKMFHQTCDNKVLEYNHSIQSVQYRVDLALFAGCGIRSSVFRSNQSFLYSKDQFDHGRSFSKIDKSESILSIFKKDQRSKILRRFLSMRISQRNHILKYLGA